MSETIYDSLIPYDEIVQEALRGVVLHVLRRVETEGLPGAHHFYITFKTKAVGVVIPPRLLQKYPDEMTIVLQHRFDNMRVGDRELQVTLSFDQIASALTIPYTAITVFADPAVEFGLQFAVSEEDLVEMPEDSDSEAGNNTPPASSGPQASDNVVTVDFSGPKKK